MLSLKASIRRAKREAALDCAAALSDNIYSSSLECGFPMPILVTTWIPQSPSNKPLYYFVLLLYEVSSGGLSDDHVGMKIFVTEGVVPNLWDPLNPKNKQDKVVEG